MNSEIIKNRLSELAKRAYEKQIYTYTDFLAMDEISVFLSMKKQIGYVPYTLFGGTCGCERQIVRFGSEELCGYGEDMPIKIVKAEPVNAKFAEKLTHRDFLGALLALGIDRQAVGDIIIKDSTAYIFCLENMAGYIAENFKQVRRTNITCSFAEGLPEDAALQLKEVTVQVSSERIDAVIAHVWHLSRGVSAELFGKELVYVNSALCLNSGKKPNEGDIISVRRMGRFIYNGVIGTTKKGKLNVSVSVYI